LISETFARDGVVDFKSLFLIPCAAAIVAAIALAVFFRPPLKREPEMAGTPVPAH